MDIVPVLPSHYATDCQAEAGRPCRDPFCDRVQQSRVGQARLAVPAGDRRLCGRSVNVLRHTATAGALDGTHGGHLAGIASVQNMGIVSVACIDHHGLERDAPVPHASQHPKARFRVLAPVLWDLRVCPPMGILGPGLRYTPLNIHRSVERAGHCRVIGQRLGSDHDLTTPYGAERPRRRRGDADRGRPFLEPFGLLNNQDALGDRMQLEQPFHTNPRSEVP